MDGLNKNVYAMIEWLHHTVNHIAESELHYYALNQIIIPILILIAIFINNRTHLLFHLFSFPEKKINNFITEFKIKNIEKKADKEKLDKIYIDNALREAASGDKEKRRNAIKQLRQYYAEDKVLNGLIKILQREKEPSFIYIIIFTLNDICERRRKKD